MNLAQQGLTFYLCNLLSEISDKTNELLLIMILVVPDLIKYSQKHKMKLSILSIFIFPEGVLN